MDIKVCMVKRSHFIDEETEVGVHSGQPPRCSPGSPVLCRHLPPCTRASAHGLVQCNRGEMGFHF